MTKELKNISETLDLCKQTIEQLREENANLKVDNERLKRENNAAINDLKANALCSTCLYQTREGTDYPCKDCPNPDGYVWRGVVEENSH